MDTALGATTTSIGPSTSLSDYSVTLRAHSARSFCSAAHTRLLSGDVVKLPLAKDLDSCAVINVNGCVLDAQPSRKKEIHGTTRRQTEHAGVRLYHQRHHAHAIQKWRSAITKLSDPEDRFITLGYLAQAFCDAGDYDTMLHYSQLQMELANDRRDEYMKSEAFLNLAKTYERLADFSKANTYGKASLSHPSMDPRTPGYAHLAIALAHLGMSQFQSSLEAFEQSMNVANETGDKLLELQICVGLGSLFTLLRDLNKALIFLRNAMAIVQDVHVDDVHAKYRCMILYHLSVALRMKGSLVEAREACDEATQLANEIGNKALMARCMCSIADIYRELGESQARETLTKSWARYEEAFRIMRSSNDRMGEVLVLASMAKSASESRSHYTGQCECQAIQLNKKCLEIAKSIGCKYVMLKCHTRLAELYSQLNDEDSEEAARRAASQLTQEMELFCNFCGQRFGLKDESLQALRCSHIFHERCLHTFLLEREDQTCPKCRCKAVLSDNLSMRTPSICSAMDLQTPSTSYAPQFPNGPVGPYGGVRTPLVEIAEDKFATLGRKKPIRETEVEIERMNKTLERIESQEGKPVPSRKKPPPPPRKPCCSKNSLPQSSVVGMPPPMELSENGPLVFSRAPTITDV